METEIEIQKIKRTTVSFTTKREKKRGGGTIIGDKPPIIHHHAPHQEKKNAVALLEARHKVKFGHWMAYHATPKRHRRNPCVDA